MIHLLLILFFIANVHAHCQAGYYSVSVVGEEGTYCTESPPCSGSLLHGGHPTSNACPGTHFLNTEGESPLENGACCAVINTKQQVGCVARTYHGVRCLATANGRGDGGVSGSGIDGTDAGTGNDGAADDTVTNDGAGVGDGDSGAGTRTDVDAGGGTDSTGTNGVGGTNGGTSVGDGDSGAVTSTDGGAGTGTGTGTGGTGTGDDNRSKTDPINNSEEGLSVGAISGIAVVALLLAAMLIALAVSRKRSSSVLENNETSAFEYEDTSLEEGRFSTKAFEVIPSPDNERHPSKAARVILYDPEIKHVKNITLYEPKVKNVTLYERSHSSLGGRGNY